MLCPALVIIDVAIKQLLEKNSNVMTARLLLTMHGHSSALVEELHTAYGCDTTSKIAAALNTVSREFVV